MAQNKKTTILFKIVFLMMSPIDTVSNLVHGDTPAEAAKRILLVLAS